MDNNVSFAEAIRSFKWSNSKWDGVNVKKTLIKEKDKEIICINNAPNTHNEFLHRSLVWCSKIRDMIVLPYRKWGFWPIKLETNLWFEYLRYGGCKLLFELARRDTAEQVIALDWIWCKTKVHLDRWMISPKIGLI